MVCHPQFFFSFFSLRRCLPIFRKFPPYIHSILIGMPFPRPPSVAQGSHLLSSPFLRTLSPCPPNLYLCYPLLFRVLSIRNLWLLHVLRLLAFSPSCSLRSCLIFVALLYCSLVCCHCHLAFLLPSTPFAFRVLLHSVLPFCVIMTSRLIKNLIAPRLHAIPIFYPHHNQPRLLACTSSLITTAPDT